MLVSIALNGPVGRRAGIPATEERALLHCIIRILMAVRQRKFLVRPDLLCHSLCCQCPELATLLARDPTRDAREQLLSSE